MHTNIFLRITAVEIRVQLVMIIIEYRFRRALQPSKGGSSLKCGHQKASRLLSPLDTPLPTGELLNMAGMWKKQTWIGVAISTFTGIWQQCENANEFRQNQKNQTRLVGIKQTRVTVTLHTTENSYFNGSWVNSILKEFNMTACGVMRDIMAVLLFWHLNL